MTYRLTKEEIGKFLSLMEELPYSCEVIKTFESIEEAMDLTGQDYVYIVGRDPNKL